MKVSRILIPVFLIALAGCIKETYDFNKLSKEAHLSPTWVVPAIRGDVSLDDLVRQGDTVIFGEDNFVRIIFRKDSVIDLKMTDYYDLTDMISFSETYQLGRMNISSFGGDINYTLDRISQRLSPSLRAQFIALDGTNSVFPSIPVTLLQESAYSLFSNFEYATLDEGYIDISVRNNLTAPIENISVALFNTSGHVPLGDPATISFISPGETGMASIDLANSTIMNSLTASVTISSPGTTTPVFIDLNGSNIEISVSARDLWVRSGRIVVPPQNISALGDDGTDTVEFDPGDGIELAFISINSGNISYTISSKTELSSDVSISLPATLKDDNPVSQHVFVNPNVVVQGNFPVNNSVFDLSTISSQPYNMMPVDHIITVSSNGQIVDFSSDDEVQIDLRFLDPDFDYVRGYFGQETETFGPDTIDPDIGDIISKITGGLYLSGPALRLNYSNSFSIPVQVELQAEGYKASETTDLSLDPFNIIFPEAPDERDIKGTFIIDKSNSKLPELISMPPYMAVFRGTAKMNPDGNTGNRDNYIFGDSRIIGSLEMDIPLELRMKNLQFADTVDNFLRVHDAPDNNVIDPDDFEFLNINLRAENGFPAGVSVSLILYDSEAGINRSIITAGDILKPAPVDNNGRVTSPVVSATIIEIKREFWDSVDQSDNIIFTFTVNTTGDGMKDVKIYSDYRIAFTAGLVIKPDLKFNPD